MRLSSAGFSPPPQEGNHFLPLPFPLLLLFLLLYLLLLGFHFWTFLKLVLATSILGGYECALCVNTISQANEVFCTCNMAGANAEAGDVEIYMFGLCFSLVYSQLRDQRKTWFGFGIRLLVWGSWIWLEYAKMSLLVWTLGINSCLMTLGWILQEKGEF